MILRKIISIIIIAGICVSSMFAKEIIAVLGLEQKGVTKQEAEILTDRLTTKLVSIDKFQLVERSNMDKILKEQKFQGSGCTESECAVEIGQLLNTDFIVIGSVSKFGSTWALDARLIDVGQGNVLISAEFSKEGKIDVLLTSGIESIANQLCGKPATTNIKQPTQSSTSTTTSYIVDSKQEGGSLSGRVNFQGNAPKKKTLKMDADPVCGAAHKTPPYRQSFIMNDEGYLKNVMVYLKDVKYDGQVPETQAVLDQNGCMYAPHVQGMMAGQELLIKNSDATLHNIHALPTINSEFNFAMPHVVKEKAIKIAKPEHAMYIKCDVHPWMKAYVSIFNHPYYAVTNDTGHYQIDNIPPGTYEVIAWQEKFKDKETKEWKTLHASVTISDEYATGQDFTFVKEAKKK